VLVVDDDADVRSLLTDLLKGDGYRVRTAKTGAEALAAVEKERPDLVMMDVKLPDQDGLAVLKELKREHSAYRPHSLPLTPHSGEPMRYGG
jgi:CheY-like chemotaxis protein